MSHLPSLPPTQNHLRFLSKSFQETARPSVHHLVVALPIPTPDQWNLRITRSIQAMKWPFDPLWFNTYPTSEHFSKSELRDKQSLRAWICFNSKQYYPKLLFFMVIYPWYAIRLKKSPDKQIQESHLFHAILKSLILFRNIWFGCCNCLPMETYILVGGWTNPFQKNARQIGWFPQGLGWKKMSCHHLG